MSVSVVRVGSVVSGAKRSLGGASDWDRVAGCVDGGGGGGGGGGVVVEAVEEVECCTSFSGAYNETVWRIGG